MSYPLLTEYLDSIRDAEDNFSDQLNHLRAVMDASGNPYMSSGNLAVVFKMQDPNTGKHYAVKCFTKEQQGREDAYLKIAEELRFVSSPYLTPIQYLFDELYVDSKQTSKTDFPVLLMDWVEGVPLDAYVQKNKMNKEALTLLSYRFSQMAVWLLSQPFAHGDLKPDNILVRNDGTLVLVDYDGMYVPEMAGQKPREIGSPDYTHPLRAKEQTFNMHIDDFALTLIGLSLKAIAMRPELIDYGKDRDVLLLTKEDFVDLGRSSVYAQIAALSSDPEMARLHAAFLENSTYKCNLDA